MTNTPLISIIIPTRNRKEFLCSAIQSVLNQSYANIEVIVSDNNSQDQSKEYILSRINDTRLKYFKSEKDLSMTENWHRAFSYIKGEYFIRLDDDNIFFLDFLENCLNFIDKYSLDVIGFSPLVVDLGNQLHFLFNADNQLYILDKYQLCYLEFYALTDTNFILYKTNLIKKIFGQSDIYNTSLPDRYLNYRLSTSISKMEIKIGISTKILGLVRFDYRPRRRSDYSFRFIDYKKLLLYGQISKAMDCQGNFAIHRVNTLSVFLENASDAKLRIFFKNNIISPEFYTSLMKIGHIYEAGSAYSFKEFVIFLKYILSLGIDFLRHPFKRLEEYPGYYLILRYFKYFLKKIIDFLTNVCLGKHRETDKVCLEFGNQLVTKVLSGNSLDMHRIKSLYGNLEVKLKTVNRYSKKLDLP